MLILASASKARRNLLEQAGISHQVVVSDVDEKKFHHDDPMKLVNSLAEAKAEAVAVKIFENSKDSLQQIRAVLGCDSLFEFQGEVFGKPVDANEAIMRWERMSGGSGFLHTGHALKYRDSKPDCFDQIGYHGLIKYCVSTRLHFEYLNTSEIEDYVASGEPMQCAGGFALEGRGGLFIRAIEGCYSNVLGLSLPWLRNTLLNLGLDIN